MRKVLLPVALIVPALLLTGCTNNTSSTSTTQTTSTASPDASSNPTATPTNTYDPNLKLENSDSSLGSTSLKIPSGTINKDGSFPAPTPSVNNIQPPAAAPAEEQASFSDFKTAVASSINKMLTEGAYQTTSIAGGTTFEYSVKKENNNLKAAMSSPDGKFYLLENLNVFVPVIAEQALNASGGTYARTGDGYAVNTKYAVYNFTVADNIIVSVSCTGKPEVEGGDFASWNANINYPVTSQGSNMIAKAIPMAW